VSGRDEFVVGVGRACRRGARAVAVATRRDHVTRSAPVGVRDDARGGTAAMRHGLRRVFQVDALGVVGQWLWETKRHIRMRLGSFS